MGGRISTDTNRRARGADAPGLGSDRGDESTGGLVAHARHPFVQGLHSPLGIFLLLVTIWDFVYDGLWVTGVVHGALFDRLTVASAVPVCAVVIVLAVRQRGLLESEGRPRTGWTMIAIGIVSFAIGYAIINAGDSSLSTPVSRLGIAFEVAAYPMVGFGLAQLARPFERTSDTLVAWLDVCIIAWSTAMLVWHFAFFPITRETHASVADAFFAAFQPVGDLSLVFAICAVMIRGTRIANLGSLGLAAISLLFLFASDVLGGVDRLHGNYAIGGLPGIFCSFAWLGLAGAVYLQSIHAPGGRMRDLSRFQTIFEWIPYVAVLVAFFGPPLYHWTDTELLEQHIPAAGFLLALLVARLMVTARQNRAFAAAERLRLATAMEQAAEAIVLTNRDWKITFANQALGRMSGYAPGSVVGQELSTIGGTNGREAIEEMRATVDRGEIWHGRVAQRRPDGQPIEADITVSPMRDGTGTFLGSVVIARDITRERALEAQLAQTQRLEAVGRLAGGIAHDFNNILTAISGFAELASASVPTDHEAQTDLHEVLRATDRAAGLTRDLLAFARRQVTQPRLVDLNEVIEGVRSMLARTLGEDIALQIRPQSGLGLTLADPSQVEQVILNLAVNARDAMPTGGMLTVTTADADLDEAYARTHPGTQAGEYVSMTVADTGTGMAPDVLEHIFEPFYSTKPRGRGTGLGLSTVSGIVGASGGFVLADSAVGSGSVFSVFLPRVASAAAKPEPAEEGGIAGGSETILVAEDEAPVRRVIERVLRAAGYNVYVASNGHEALAMAPTLPHLDLLLSDVVMPGMSGPELARQLLMSRPDLRIIFASGYSGDSLIRVGARESVPYLAKPFSTPALLALVRDVLDSPAPDPFE